MSQENVAIVRRMLQAFNDGDVEALVAECDPSVEWEEQSIPGVDPLYRGHEGVRRWAATIRAMETELGSLEGRLERVKETDENTVIASLCLEGEGTSILRKTDESRKPSRQTHTGQGRILSTIGSPLTSKRMTGAIFVAISGASIFSRSPTITSAR